MRVTQKGCALRTPLAILAVFLFIAGAQASYGDKLPEFGNCVRICKTENCAPGRDLTPIPLHRRLLFWDCAAECDYACQHIITDQRVAAGEPIVQFHGKWPFVRFLGMQEPFSVIFSLGNLWAHRVGLAKLRANVPATYPLLPYYKFLAYIGTVTWTFSAIFHTRDFTATEQLDYFAAGASVLYGMYYTPVRIFRLDRRTPRHRALLRAWTIMCIALYAAHVAYLKGVRWDYTYNMAANVAAGIVQNVLWSWYSIKRYLKTGKSWTLWPFLGVLWLTAAMSLELFDFAPFWRSVDAHSLWHLGTIAPMLFFYDFLVKDAQDDIAGLQRIKS